jgi:hypothetical protein
MPGETYKPSPVDTKGVEVPAELHSLAEKLAENAHEVWAVQRISDGWSYGSQRDDTQKKHPCLIPYRDLPDSEKVYDRKMSGETLKMILALGFRILPPPR